MSLQEQIDERRQEIQTAAYPMSIGELVNLYRDDELDIHPEFQRFFRWTQTQKSRFIESLLLGIPIPSIFVFQRRDGVWDLIDGLQRVSTILEFMGELKDEAGNRLAPAELIGTEYLPALNGTLWSSEIEGFDHGRNTPLTSDQQRLIKRASIDIKIINRESDENAKFDLFQRLNTGGSELSAQEVRNSMLIMVNPDYYRGVSSLREDEYFQGSTTLPERSIEEQYDQELVIRFLALKNSTNDELGRIRDLSDFLTKYSVNEAKKGPISDDDKSSFANVFRLLWSALGESTFRRYDQEKGKFLGAFTVSAFEAVTLGLYANLDGYVSLDSDYADEVITARVKALWQADEFRKKSGMGVRANSRISAIVPFARQHFAL